MCCGSTHYLSTLSLIVMIVSIIFQIIELWRKFETKFVCFLNKQTFLLHYNLRKQNLKMKCGHTSTNKLVCLRLRKSTLDPFSYIHRKQPPRPMVETSFGEVPTAWKMPMCSLIFKRDLQQNLFLFCS